MHELHGLEAYISSPGRKEEHVYVALVRHVTRSCEDRYISNFIVSREGHSEMDPDASYARRGNTALQVCHRKGIRSLDVLNRSAPDNPVVQLSDQFVDRAYTYRLGPSLIEVNIVGGRDRPVYTNH